MGGPGKSSAAEAHFLQLPTAQKEIGGEKWLAAIQEAECALEGKSGKTRKALQAQPPSMCRSRLLDRRTVSPNLPPKSPRRQAAARMQV